MSSLGDDLATIRKQQKKTLGNIHETTKIPPRVLNAIEDGSIFTNFGENKTYIRSYIRSYAKALKIKDNLIIKALDQVEAGTYAGKLLEETGGDVSKRPKFTYDEEAFGEENEVIDDREEKTHDDISPLADAASNQSDSPTPQSAPSVNSVDWADMGHKFTPLQNKSRVWIGVVFFLVAIVIVVGIWMYAGNPESTQVPGETPSIADNILQPAVEPDSLQLNLNNRASGEEDTTTNTSLMTGQYISTMPDTLSLLIYAAYDKLEPVRVYSDLMRALNPYWIEKGQAFRFRFVNFIRIYGQFSRMELIINGHPIEDFRNRFMHVINPDSVYIQLDRSYFEENDEWRQLPPDSTELNFSPPSSVLDRPTFN